MILNEISFDVEIVISLEILQLEVFRNQLKGRTEVYGKCSFCIWSSNEDHSSTRRVNSFKQGGFDAVLSLIALEKMSKIVITDFEERCKA